MTLGLHDFGKPFEELKKQEPEPPFKVGQVVMIKRSGKKRDIPAEILEIVTEDGQQFYRVDRKNCLSAKMIRWLTSDEMGW